MTHNDNNTIAANDTEVPKKGRFARRKKNLSKKNQTEIDRETGLQIGSGIESLQYKDSTLSLTEVSSVYKQLGYVPCNIVNIAARSKNNNRPLVIQLYPLNSNNLGGKYTSTDGTLLPFPTMV